MNEYTGRVVAITGAGSGIGRDLAGEFAARGARLAICDIDGERLRVVAEELAGRGNEVLAEVVDVAQAWQVEEFCNSTYRAFGRVDVLVNNAGVGLGGYMEDVPLEDWQWIMGVNLWGVVHGCHFFYPRMIEQGGGGHIVNIASAAALSPLPLVTAYSCTKGGVLLLSETLRGEARRHDIGVTAVCPGLVSTSIAVTARSRCETKHSDADRFADRLVTVFDRANVSPARIVRATLRAIERNKAVAPAGWEAHLIDYVHRFSRGLAALSFRVSLWVVDRFM